MPTYEYVCRDCGQHLEVVQSFKDAPLTTCGRCEGALRKVFSAAGIIFKGSGYYVTDTRKKAAESSSGSDRGGKAEQSEKKDSKATDAGGSKEKDAKPAKESGAGDAKGGTAASA